MPTLRLVRVLAAAALGLTGCGRPLPVAVPASVERPATGSTLPSLALAYAPGEDATERAIAAAQAQLRADPHDARHHAALAMALLRRASETSNPVYVRYAEDVLRVAPAGSAAATQLEALSIMTLQDRHRFAEAAQRAEALAVAAPHDPTGPLLLGDARLELGEYEAAADAYQAAIDRRPDLRGYNRAAYMRWLYGDVEGAKQLLELAIDAGSARDPASIAWCFSDLSRVYLHAGDARRALAAADRALQLVADYYPARIARAEALHREGAHDDAIATLGAAMDRRPAARELLLLAQWLDAKGRAEEARQQRALAERLADDDPRPVAHDWARRGVRAGDALRLSAAELDTRRNIPALDTRALALWRADRIDEARATIDAAVALDTADADLHLHAALIAEADGDESAARRHLARALQLDPQVDPSLRAQLRVAPGVAS